VTLSAGRVRAVLVLISGALVALYLVEAWAHHSPWIFFDELEHARNSRAIADLGVKPGAKPWTFDGLYTFFTAPAWLGGVGAGYFAAKAIGVVLMTLTALPAYGIARAIGSSRLPALFAAAGTVVVPAMTYSSTLMTETLAYPYATLCLFLYLKAARSHRWLFPAVVAAIVAPVVRTELAVVPASFAAAALVQLALPRLGRSWKRWTIAVVSAAVVLALLAWAATYVSATWSEAVRHPIHMFTYARSGAAAIVVGVAILPAIAALTALVRPRDEPSNPGARAFVPLVGCFSVTLLLYTAAKGTYLGSLANPVEERNLIYLLPLLFAGTALWLTRRRIDPLALIAATALVVLLLVTVPLHLDPFIPASDAPSLEVLFSIGWSSAALHGLLAAVSIVAAVVIATSSGRGFRVAAVACSLVLVWCLASELYVSRRSADYASALAAPLPRPLDWVDRTTGGRSAVYVGQEILQPTDIWLMTFWNPSVVQMRTLDGTPAARRYHDIGSTGDIYPARVTRRGKLRGTRGVEFLVGDRGVTGRGSALATGERWRVYRGARLGSAAVGVFSDGWMGERSTFKVYGGRGRTLRVRLSRANACGAPGAWHASLRIRGAVRARGTGAPCGTVTLTAPAPHPPFTAKVSVVPAFVPAELDPNLTDTRRLGAVVTYTYGS
jgi:hypothetical protein